MHADERELAFPGSTREAPSSEPSQADLLTSVLQPPRSKPPLSEHSIYKLWIVTLTLVHIT